MVGQCCAAQGTLTVRIGSRSAFARACGTLASTGGAKLGKIAMAAANESRDRHC